jgi:hypothetical protein
VVLQVLLEITEFLMNLLINLFLMKNRGPDDQLFCHSKVNNSLNIYLLHSRLSIIDLKNKSNQLFKKNILHKFLIVKFIIKIVKNNFFSKQSIQSSVKK